MKLTKWQIELIDQKDWVKKADFYYEWKKFWVPFLASGFWKNLKIMVLFKNPIASNELAEEIFAWIDQNLKNTRKFF